MTSLQTAFDILGEPRRREILSRLRAAPQTVGEIIQATGLSQPGASKHLRMLRDSGFVAVEKRGKQRVYSLVDEPLMELDAWLADYRAKWSRTLDALGSHLERNDHE
jgi:DNA-binding transcriptional ArsR family regulator